MNTTQTFSTIHPAPMTGPRKTPAQAKLELHQRRDARAHRQQVRMQSPHNLNASDLHSRSEKTLLRSGQLVHLLTVGKHIEYPVLESTAWQATRYIPRCLMKMQLLGQQLLDRAQHAQQDQQAVEPVADLLQMLSEAAATYGASAQCFFQALAQCRDVDIKSGSRLGWLPERFEKVDASVLDECNRLQDKMRRAAHALPPELLQRVPLLKSMLEPRAPRKDLR